MYWFNYERHQTFLHSLSMNCQVRSKSRIAVCAHCALVTHIWPTKFMAIEVSKLCVCVCVCIYIYIYIYIVLVYDVNLSKESIICWTNTGIAYARWLWWSLHRYWRFGQVALKSMMVIHRTLREGDPTFRDELLNYARNRGHVLNLSNFKDDSSPSGALCFLT
jgi:hypothetical protein